MLGRTVDAVARSIGDPKFVWGNTLDRLRKADLALGNLECAIAHAGTGRAWSPKVFHFKAQPWAIESLQAAGITAVSLANNHVLDYHEEALLEMIRLLDEAGIAHSGAGDSLAAASQPAMVGSQGGLRVALIAVTDNEPDWEAGEKKAGIFYVPLEARGVRFARLVRTIQKAKRRADLVVVSAHVGPHLREAPDPEYVAFARAAIDAGADVYMGTSNHAFQGIEIYQGRPILYDLGDFVDDYAVDPLLRNDWSFLFRLEFDGWRLRSLWLSATVIAQMQVNLARGREREAAVSRMERLCRDLGTTTRRVRGQLELILE